MERRAASDVDGDCAVDLELADSMEDEASGIAFGDSYPPRYFLHPGRGG